MLKITVPATSANIGAGFDTMGLALDLYNSLEFYKSDRTEIITDFGLPSDGRNLVVSVMQKVFNIYGAEMPKFKLIQTNNIPVSSGLGSSAACIAAGVFAANIMLGKKMTMQQIIELCTQIEGHPDNIVPALTGGITANMVSDGKVTTIKFMPKNRIKLVLFTPDYPMETKTARSILPKQYTREDVVFNLSHALVTLCALEKGDLEILDESIGDKIHEPYRFPLIEDSENIISLLKSFNIKGIYLSGAGPTIAGFVPYDYNGYIDISGGTVRVLSIAETGIKAEGEF